MRCYVCALEGNSREAVALCLDHLKEEQEADSTEPKYSCTHEVPPQGK